jgi:ligand-binding sensor domain-containing protein
MRLIPLQRCFIILFFIIGISSGAHSLAALKIVNYNAADGLANNHVLCVEEDSRGVLWVGTYSGVQIFDGYDFQIFNENSRGDELFTNHVVYAIAEDKNHNMWFGTEFGLNKYDVATGVITRIIKEDDSELGLSHNNIRDIYIDDDGLIWLGTYGGGITIFDEKNQKYSHLTAIEDDTLSLQSNFINSFYADNNELLVATEQGGISIIDVKEKRVKQNLSGDLLGTSGIIVNQVFRDHFDNYWISTWNHGLIQFSREDSRFKKIKVFWPGKRNEENVTVRWIEQTDKEFLWVGTFGNGLFKYYIREERCEKVELGVLGHKNTKQDYIWSLKKDKNNNIWISTFGSGIFMISKDRNIFPSYMIQDEDTGVRLSIACFYEDEDRNLWIGTYNGGVYLFDQSSGNYSKANLDPVVNDRVSCIFRDRKKRLWVGVERGLYIFSPDMDTYRFFQQKSGLFGHQPNSIINSIIEDNNGDFWLGYWGSGVKILKGEELESDNINEIEFQDFSQVYDELPNQNIWKLFQDSKDNIWVASSGRLARINQGASKLSTVELYSVSSLFEDNSGAIWVNAMGDGLYQLNSDYSIGKSYTSADGLSSNTLMGLFADDHDRLWVGTDKGISVVDTRTDFIVNFNRNHGLEFGEVAIGAYEKTESGKIVFGGNEGFTVFQPEGISKKNYQEKVRISDIRVMHKSLKREAKKENVQHHLLLDGLDTIEIAHDQNFLSIDFVALNYSNPQEIYYSYKLDGLNKDWILTDAKIRTASYTNLKPGTYTFRVKASQNVRNWGSEVTTLFIRVKQPLLLQKGFLIFYIILGILGFVFFLRFKIRNGYKVLLDKNGEISVNKLFQDNDALSVQNERLNTQLLVSNKKIASLTYRLFNSGTRMRLIHNSLVEIDNDSAGNLIKKNKLKPVLKALEDLPDHPLDDEDLRGTVNLFFDDFQKRLLENYPRLSVQDLRICSYIRMNIPNKELSLLLNITSGSLDTSRYRLRKKLCLDSKTNLNEFILKF